MGEYYLRRAVANVDGREIRNLRMAFKVEKTLKSHPNQAELRIWNLSKDSRAKMKKDLLVSIQAGYQEDISLIFSGTMRKVDHPQVGPDIITRARIGDGEKEIKKSKISTSFKGKATPEQVLKKLAEATGLKVGNAIKKAQKGDLDGALKELTTGVVLSGNPYDIMQTTARNLGYDLSVQDGALIMLGADETLDYSAYLLSAQTGLVGSPEQAESSVVKGGIIKCVSLLNGELIPGREVMLKSRQFDGSCRIEKVTFQGDTHGAEWFANLELKRLGGS